MPLEHALLDVVAGREREFEAAFREAREIIVQQPGFLWLRLERCLERPTRYLLLVEWERLEDHTEGFRKSHGYARWRELLHHFYDPFPEVLHFVGAQVDSIDEEDGLETEDELRERVRSFVASGGDAVELLGQRVIDVVGVAMEQARTILAEVDATTRSKVQLWISSQTLRHGVGSEAATRTSAASTLTSGLLYDNRP
jgi:heme-degrading monooxygenase HmoA